jgi:hypothetical protein
VRAAILARLVLRLSLRRTDARAKNALLDEALKLWNHRLTRHDGVNIFSGSF